MTMPMSGFINIRNAAESAPQRLDFTSALLRGLGEGGGLYMPAGISPLEDCAGLLEQPFVERSVQLLRHLIGDDSLAEQLPEIVQQAFNFPVPVKHLSSQVCVLELFHGPSQSFKDFGARFLAGCLQHSQLEHAVTVLTATSGDTGGAVARAFYGQPNTQVVVVYPQAGVTEQQAKHFIGLGGNVHSIAIDGSFDDCQRMVKRAFADQAKFNTKLISANSINVARLLAQVCYYFELAAQKNNSGPLTVAIPSGNFGNATAAMIACAMGLPFKKVLSVTNENDTVPRYLRDGDWRPQDVIRTITNAIDIAAPNNFSRIQYLRKQQPGLLPEYHAISIDEQATRLAMQALSANGYLADPHTSLAWAGAKQARLNGEHAAIVATAHPAKFADEVQSITGVSFADEKPTTAIINPAVSIAPSYQNLSDILLQI